MSPTKKKQVDFLSTAVVRAGLAMQSAFWQTAAEEYPEDAVREAFEQAKLGACLEVDLDSFFPKAGK